MLLIFNTAGPSHLASSIAPPLAPSTCCFSTCSSSWSLSGSTTGSSSSSSSSCSCSSSCSSSSSSSAHLLFGSSPSFTTGSSPLPLPSLCLTHAPLVPPFLVSHHIKPPPLAPLLASPLAPPQNAPTTVQIRWVFNLLALGLQSTITVESKN